MALATAGFSARRRPTLLVDLCGDQPALIGAQRDGPDLGDWLRAEAVAPGALDRLAWTARTGLRVVSVGSHGAPAGVAGERYALLAAVLAQTSEFVVVDLGTPRPESGALVDALDRSVLVTRACYLALVAAGRGPTPDEVVVVREPGRALRRDDCAAAVGAPVVAEIEWDPAVARAADAGLLIARPPRSLRPLEGLV